MELTFVHQYSGDAPKRRRLVKACDACRSRKKRCIHFADDNDNDNDNDNNNDGEDSTRTEAALCAPAADSAHSHSTSTSAANRKRFMSDLNPEALFLSRSTPRNIGDKRANEDIGIWIDRAEYDALIRQSARNQAPDSNARLPDQRPHSSVLTPLIDIYFKKIHPILPLLDEGQFRREYAGGIVPEPMAHALCLVAAKDPEAAPHLCLVQSKTPLPPREFCSRMHASVMGALKTTCRFDKLTLIRILALTSMHSEGFEGAEAASLCISQAMHHAQTLGIHLATSSAANDEHEMSMKRLFWCLWALDRYNSSINGRPLVMADHDMGQAPFAPGESGFPAFEVLLRITDTLNRVIDYYRPCKPLDSTGWEHEYPDLEHMFDDIPSSWDLPQSIINTLHMHYLMGAILSHRGRGVKQISRSTHSSIRQRLCALEVVRFMESHAQDVHQFPAIPYVVSLSLAVAYQHLRQSQILHQQEDARRELRACLKVLHQLRRIWCSVDTTTAMARKVLDELDKAPDLAIFRIPRSAKLLTNGIVQQDAILPPSACTPLDALQRDVINHEGQEAVPATDERALDGVLFDGMDDVFGAYLDPNYPIQLDDMSFVDDLSPWDWSEPVTGVT